MKIAEKRHYQSIFPKDSPLQNALNEKGYVKIPLLDKAMLKELNADTETLLTLLGDKYPKKEFLSTGRIEDSEIRVFSTKSIRKIHPILQEVFNRQHFDFISGIHLLKPTGATSSLNPHQDSALIEEENYNAAYVWIPLIDTDAKNGGLFVLPYSHLLDIPQRSLSVAWPLMKFEKLLWKFMVPLEVKAGEAIVFDSNLIHSSSPNTGENIRVAINYFIKPKEAKYLHFFTNHENKKVEVYHVDPDFYYTCNILERPPAPYIKIREENNRNRKFNYLSLLMWLYANRSQ